MQTLMDWITAVRCRHLIACAASLILFFGCSVAAQSPPTISKAFSAANIPLSTSVTLTFTITNPNPATDLTNVAFVDNLPAGLIIANPDSLVVDPVLGNCDPTGTTGVITPAVSSISLAGGQIPANATCTFSIDVLSISGGTQVNTTDPITSTEGGTGGTATATVDVVLPDLTITKTHVGNFRQGQIGATYTITVSDSGADTNAAVMVTDSLPAGLTATSIGGIGWSCTTPPILNCTRPDALAAGTSFPDITVTVNVAANAPALLTNTAQVSGGGESDTSNDTATDATNIDLVGDLIITKAHNGSFSPGQTGATYTLTVKNLGPGPTLGTVTVTDTLPNVPNTFVPTAMSGTGWTCTLGTLTCTRSDILAANASYPPITLTVNVPANIQANVTNSASVSGGGELNTANDTASDPTHIGAPLQIVAQVANLMVSPGSVTSTVFNVDSSAGLGAVTFACSGLPAGASCSFNPSSVNQLTAQVTMTINVPAAASSVASPIDIVRTPVYALLLGFAAITLSLARSRKLRLRLVFAVAIIAVLASLGCGGRSNHVSNGVFTVTVTATSASGASANTTVTLTVL